MEASREGEIDRETEAWPKERTNEGEDGRRRGESEVEGLE